MALKRVEGSGTHSACKGTAAFFRDLCSAQRTFEPFDLPKRNRVSLVEKATRDLQVEADQIGRIHAEVGEPPALEIIDGNLSIHDWTEAFRMDLPPGRVTTVGGFVTSLLGRIPKEGEQVRYRNLRITVLSLRGRRIGELQVELVSTGDSRRAEGGE